VPRSAVPIGVVNKQHKFEYPFAVLNPFAIHQCNVVNMYPGNVNGLCTRTAVAVKLDHIETDEATLLRCSVQQLNDLPCLAWCWLIVHPLNLRVAPTHPLVKGTPQELVDRHDVFNSERSPEDVFINHANVMLELSLDGGQKVRHAQYDVDTELYPLVVEVRTSLHHFFECHGPFTPAESQLWIDHPDFIYDFSRNMLDDYGAVAAADNGNDNKDYIDFPVTPGFLPFLFQ
jgi:hypothetical protein